MKANLRPYVLASFIAAASVSSLEATAGAVYTGSSGSLAASVSFEKIGTDLQVILTNTSMADVMIPSDVLTSVFFNIAGNPLLGSTSAILTSGSTVFFDTQPVGGVVGGEWGYLNGLNQYGANSGISSSGYGVFGQATFPGANLGDPLALDGLQYGITSAGDNSTTGNSAVTGGNASGNGSNELIQNSVTFMLSGFNGSLSDIGKITFQYGTALNEPHFTGKCITGCTTTTDEIPEPGILLLLGIGVVGLGLSRRRRV